MIEKTKQRLNGGGWAVIATVVVLVATFMYTLSVIRYDHTIIPKWDTCCFIIATWCVGAYGILGRRFGTFDEIPTKTP